MLQVEAVAWFERPRHDDKAPATPFHVPSFTSRRHGPYGSHLDRGGLREFYYVVHLLWDKRGVVPATDLR